MDMFRRFGIGGENVSKPPQQDTKETIDVRINFGHFLAQEDLNAIKGGRTDRSALHTTLEDAIHQVQIASLLTEERKQRLIGELQKIASSGRKNTLAGELGGTVDQLRQN